MPVFPSEEWVGEWVALANHSAQFEASGSEWEGSVAAVIDADPDAGVSKTLYVRLEGRHGKWVSHSFGTDAGLADGTLFVLRAPYACWKEVIRGRLGPLKGLLQGKIRVRGHLPVFLRWTQSLVVLSELAGRLDTEFVDERPSQSEHGTRDGS